MFDVHVHSAPCVLPRHGDDRDVVGAYEAAGFDGCVLKGHCEPTVGRARAAGAGRSVDVYGGVVLNHPVGGISPAAVAATLALGGRVVWMPTVDAAAHREDPPYRATCTPGLPDGPGLAVPPRDDRTADPVRTILSLVADADAVLATGHLSAPECAWLVTEARRAGVRRIVLTHPGFAVPGIDAATTRELCDAGATAEVTTFQLLHQPGMDAGRLAAFVREVGVEHCLLSSDAGQPDSPSPPDALARLVDDLAAAGLDRGACEAMAAEVPAELVVP